MKIKKRFFAPLGMSSTMFWFAVALMLCCSPVRAGQYFQDFSTFAVGATKSKSIQ
jgi:hypothetical protein